MPAPSAATFSRLADLIAIDNVADRPTKSITEKEWAKRSVLDRAAVFHRYRDLILENRDALMDMAQAETGKSRTAAQEEVLDISMTSRHYARVAPKLLRPRRVSGMLPGLTKTVAGLPRDLFAVVPGPGSVVGTALVENTDYLMFTGSTATGQLLAEQAGRRLIGFSAELGGKNPMIVAAGADLREVTDAAVRACFSNSGQLCISIERIYVEESIAPEFIRMFGDRVKKMNLAAGYEFGIEMGSLVSEAQVKAISAHVDDAVVKGATVIAGGKARPDIGPLFYEPTLLTGVPEDAECYRDETFGPLVSIYPVKDVEEAIAAANDTEYGLNASVWAGSKAAGEAIAARIHAGTVNVDEGYAPTWGSTAAPMGGMGVSGVGRRHGAEGLIKYTEPQTVATTRVMNLGGPRGLPAKVWAKLMPHAIKIMSWVPGRAYIEATPVSVWKVV
eukprot:gene19714-23609_t